MGLGAGLHVAVEIDVVALLDEVEVERGAGGDPHLGRIWWGWGWGVGG